MDQDVSQGRILVPPDRDPFPWETSPTGFWGNGVAVVLLLILACILLTRRRWKRTLLRLHVLVMLLATSMTLAALSRSLMREIIILDQFARTEGQQALVERAELLAGIVPGVFMESGVMVGMLALQVGIGAVLYFLLATFIQQKTRKSTP